MSGPIRFALLTAFSLSITLNVGLVTYAFRHSHPFEAASAQQAPPPGEGKVPIKIGAPAPIIKATDIAGKAVVLDPTKEPTVLYILRPKCDWCEKNTPNIVALAKQAGSRYHFIGLSLHSEELEPYLKRFGLPFPVFVASEETIKAYGFAPTPSTVLITEGKIAYKINGAYDPYMQNVEDKFGVKLPGMAK